MRQYGPQNAVDARMPKLSPRVDFPTQKSAECVILDLTSRYGGVPTQSRSVAVQTWKRMASRDRQQLRTACAAGSATGGSVSQGGIHDGMSFARRCAWRALDGEFVGILAHYFIVYR